MKRLLFLLVLFLVPAVESHAQNTKMPEVTISKEKANIAGKVYYVHRVLPKQTLFSLSKAYGIRIEDLVKANPDLKDGLKANSIILIPADAAKLPETAGSDKQEQAETKPASPQEDEPKAAGEGAGATTDPAVGRVVEYRAKWFETLTGIAKRFNVSEDILRDYNGLKPFEPIRGKVLLIPIMETDGTKNQDTALSDDRLSIMPEAAEGREAETPMPPVHKRWFSADEPLRIALILPFNLSGNTASSPFLNFYCGALMAVREQKEKGAHLVLNVYDLSKGADAILTDPGFQKSDLIVGPVEAATLPPFLAFSDRKGIPIVSPLDHKADSLVAHHPFLFQLPASPEIQLENLIHSLRAHSNEPVILVTGISTDENRLLDQMETLLRADGIAYRKVTSGDLSASLGSRMNRNPAKILIGSESKTFTADVIRNLNTLAKRNIPMEVWCTNRVRNFETSDPDALFNLSVHTSAPYFVDYSDPRDQAFVLQYRALYFAEPDEFAFQGHDVFTYFIASLMQHGTAFLNNAEEYPLLLLHCNVHFVREDKKGGWRNCATRNLKFNKEDFSVTITR